MDDFASLTRLFEEIFAIHFVTGEFFAIQLDSGEIRDYLLDYAIEKHHFKVVDLSNVATDTELIHKLNQYGKEDLHLFASFCCAPMVIFKDIDKASPNIQRLVTNILVNRRIPFKNAPSVPIPKTFRAGITFSSFNSIQSELISQFPVGCIMECWIMTLGTMENPFSSNYTIEQLNEVTVCHDIEVYIRTITRNLIKAFSDVCIIPNCWRMIMKMTRAISWLNGQSFVIPDDVLGAVSVLLPHIVMARGNNSQEDEEGNASDSEYGVGITIDEVMKIVDEVIGGTEVPVHPIFKPHLLDSDELKYSQ
eukprot:TRINITY_DN775980_c0_g1_i1.p1 TRINITY_DN775980_c0_g1~~TRINITY_DN775980_c0_g1_i1.p1  ORF type:complete len:307 (+),score=39.61 TRINITY_DN775980_c0_g1_i1:46-966(+)